MLQVVSPIPMVQKILGAQKTANGTLYRLSTHCMRVQQPEGVLFYHTLTGELLLLSHEEAASLRNLPGHVPAALEELVSRYFLMPQDADDMAIADHARQISEHFKKKATALTEYTIFTTMDCNARCFYCYQAGWKKSFMSEQTALDTAAYIAAHRGGKPVHLHWFGGEPLVNIRAIDVITDFLRRQGVEFRSTMISNGYLFDEALARRAKDDWALEQVQITLDGTEEVYNQRKAYVHPQGSPYKRVVQNIGLLLDAGIAVTVRMNMDDDNEKDLYDLCDELAERFAGKPGFGVYLTVIWEDVGNVPPSYTEEKRRSYAKKLQSMQAYVAQKRIGARVPLKRGIVANACLADGGKYSTVTPEGLLGRCDTSKDGAIWGSIYSDKVDEDVLRQWQERKPAEEACKTCPIYPRCIRLKKCPGWLEHCSPIEQLTREERLRRSVLSAYEDWKTAGQN